jgi:16S rRNA (guanine1516-N2)-methyltransferase
MHLELPYEGLCLSVSSQGLGLGFAEERPFRPYRVDFTDATWKRRALEVKRSKQIFARALGLHRHPGARVLDGTAGFAQDAFFMTLLGARVVALEQSPVMFELILEGMLRARKDEWSCEFASRLELINANFFDWIQKAPSQLDVIYLDPMFDKPKTSAKSPKPMQLLQSLILQTPQQVLLRWLWMQLRFHHH